jgi:hypothetical protein
MSDEIAQHAEESTAQADVPMTEAEAIEQTHVIERRMLNRAIQVIATQTDMTPEDVIEQLSIGIADEYSTSVRQVTAKDRLYVPPKPTLHL